MGTVNSRHTVRLSSMYSCGKSFQVNKTSEWTEEKYYHSGGILHYKRAAPVHQLHMVASDLAGSTGEHQRCDFWLGKPVVPLHVCESGMPGDTKSLLWLLLLSGSSLCFGSEFDIQCLKSVQQSVIDPMSVLKSSWNFENGTDGFICRFTGVECWHPGENRVLSLRLGNLGLEGTFPQGLQDCTSMSGLDLSNNNFSGPIPPDISQQVPYLTALDLSYNSFSGEIPSVRYLNLLNLQDNQLSGPIPAQFNLLSRLNTFSVADNLLSGTIPSFLQRFSASNFVGNQGLCDSPLHKCSEMGLINDESSIGAAIGFVAGFVVAFYFPHRLVCAERLRAYVVRI